MNIYTVSIDHEEGNHKHWNLASCKREYKKVSKGCFFNKANFKKYRVIVGRVCSGKKFKKKDYDHKLPLNRQSSPLHSNITEHLPMPTSPEPSAKKFEENKISALKGTEVNKPVTEKAP